MDLMALATSKVNLIVKFLDQFYFGPISPCFSCTPAKNIMLLYIALHENIMLLRGNNNIFVLTKLSMTKPHPPPTPSHTQKGLASEQFASNVKSRCYFVTLTPNIHHTFEPRETQNIKKGRNGRENENFTFLLNLKDIFNYVQKNLIGS